MNGTERVWRRADLALQVALARGLSLRAAARAAGVSESTVRRRRRDPAFRTEVERRTEELAAELVKIAAADLTGLQQRDTRNAARAAQLPQTDVLVHTEAATPAPVQPAPPAVGHRPQQTGPQESRITGSAHVAEAQPRRDAVAAAPQPTPATVAPAAPRIGSARHEPPTVEKGKLPHWLVGVAVAAGLAGMYMMLHKIGAAEYYRNYEHAPPPARAASTPNLHGT